MSREEKLFVGAGLVTWAAAGAPLLTRAAGLPPLAVASYVAFVVFFLVTMFGKAAGVRAASLVAQSLVALTLAWACHGGSVNVTLVVVASEVPFIVGPRAALPWAAAQTVVLGAIDARDFHGFGLLVDVGVYAGFELFGVAAATFAVREGEARRELGRVNAELLATRELFADSTRTAERLRIARDVHDVLGHHLTALILSLEHARSTVAPSERESVDRAHAIAKALLAELREVVGAMREDQPVDVASALRTLVAGIKGPRVHLTLPKDPLEDAAAAHAIFRCVQEVLTNAMRHARAKNVWVDVVRDAGSVRVSARDDGRGMRVLVAGNGLAGMRERVEELGGDVAIDSRAGRGTTVNVRVPLCLPGEPS